MNKRSELMRVDPEFKRLIKELKELDKNLSDRSATEKIARRYKKGNIFEL